MSHGLMSRAVGDLRAHWRPVLGWHLIIQLLGLAIFAPIATWIGRHLVLAAGEPVISNFDIVGFVLSPAGATFVVLAAALTVGLLLAEFAGHTWIAGHALARRAITTTGTVAYVLRRLPRLFRLSLRVFVRLVVLALPFLAAAAIVWFATLGEHDINFYLAEEPPEWRRALLLATAVAVAYAVLAAWQLARWLYAVPLLVFEDATPAGALARSSELTRGRLGRIVPPLVAWWLALTVVAIAVTWACRQVSGTGLDWAGIDVRRVLPLVAVYLAVSTVGAVLYGALHLAGQQFLVTRLFAEQRDPAQVQRLAAEDAVAGRSPAMAKPALFIAVGLCLLALCVGGLVIAGLDLHDDAAITAHRGASVAAPENSMAAFRAALAAGATYVELDVQHTGDRRIVVLHDADLMRMGADPRRVAELTAAEIGAIDIGRKYDTRFAGETPPTLEQVIDLVRGRMRLNIELKYNVPDPDLAPAVIELLRRKNFLDQVVITSLDYAALQQVESIAPGLRTGHIITASVGNVLRTEADFLSLNSAQATPSLVRRAHRAGKEVHVWTVNEPEVMLRMIERGVDNIITDDPALLARVLRERAALTTPEILGLRLRVLFARPPRAVTDPAAVEPL
jgi:glycerophosphoryl diester phosphodiesterase